MAVKGSGYPRGMNFAPAASVSFAVMLLLSGCATTAPEANFIKPIAPASRLTIQDKVEVHIKPHGNLYVSNFDRRRLTARLQGRLESMKMLNPPNGKKRSYSIEVTLTRYDEGDALTRLLFFGFGQVHVNGTVLVAELPSKAIVGEFTVHKAFAWGGPYGGFTDIEDVEKGFADGVVLALTGQDRPAPWRTVAE
jgi:hypothetical protein